MRRLLLLTLATVLLAPQGWAGGRTAPIAPRIAALPTTPLVQLGGLLQGALPQLSQLSLSRPTLSGPSLTAAAVPAVMDIQRAEVLLRRLPEVGKPAAMPVSQEQAPQASAVEVLAAVNSTLKDFSPEDLRRMPAEDLHALSAVVLDQLGRPQGQLDDGLALMSDKRAALVLAKRGRPASEVLHNPGHNDLQESIVTSHAVPEAARLLRPTARSQDQKAPDIPEPKGGFVFRHYTTEEGVKEILKTSRLWNGFLPYIQLVPHVLRKSFDDLTGVFLTLPEVAGREVGVPSSQFQAYVDIRVPEGFPILELEPGAIYLIPMPGRTRDWVKDMYRRWTQGQGVASGYEGMVRGLDQNGGPGPELAVPVEIVGHGLAK